MKARALYLGAAVASAALIGFALYLQEFEHLEPCPLCILQRYAYVGLGLMALLAAILPRVLARVLAWLGFAFGLAGAGVGVWHVWLEQHPPKVPVCGPSLEYLVGNLPLGRALPRIFQGYGDCTQIVWTFLGLSIPAWSVICLALLCVALAVAQARR
jgi:disulfide bond formation protein DsbB